MFLPLEPQQKDVTQVTLRVAYKPKDGAPMYASNTPLHLTPDKNAVALALPPRQPLPMPQLLPPQRGPQQPPTPFQQPPTPFQPPPPTPLPAPTGMPLAVPQTAQTPVLMPAVAQPLPLQPGQSVQASAFPAPPPPAPVPFPAPVAPPPAVPAPAVLAPVMPAPAPTPAVPAPILPTATTAPVSTGPMLSPTLLPVGAVAPAAQLGANQASGVQPAVFHQVLPSNGSAVQQAQAVLVPPTPSAPVQAAVLSPATVQPGTVPGQPGLLPASMQYVPVLVQTAPGQPQQVMLVPAQQFQQLPANNAVVPPGQR
jgi:hypothetical protein